MHDVWFERLRPGHHAPSGRRVPWPLAPHAARRLGKKPGIILKSLGANVSPLSYHVGSGTTEENYRRNQLDAAGITIVVRQILKK